MRPLLYLPGQGRAGQDDLLQCDGLRPRHTNRVSGLCLVGDVGWDVSYPGFDALQTGSGIRFMRGWEQAEQLPL